MAKSYWIVILPGDGIGPEIVDAALEVLETVQNLLGRFSLIYEFHQAGAECYRETSAPITPEALEAIQRTDATLKGPVGLPDVRRPDGTEAGLLGGELRVRFDLFANIRPIRLYPTENMFGDILSDLGGATIGGLGMCPAANIGEKLSYFEPIHGSAPDIAGRSRANPTSQILASAMMLKHLGEQESAALLEDAVWELYSQNCIPLTVGGAVEGGPAVVVKALKPILRKLADRL